MASRRQFAFMFSGRDRQGLTLVELLAALTLSVILLSVTMGLSSRLSRNQELLKNEFPFDSLRWRLEAQINDDYQNSRSIIVDMERSEVSMLTCRSFNPDGVTMNQLPSAVVYRLVRTDKESYLVRTERCLISNSQRWVDRSIVCRGVRRFGTASRLETDYPPPSLILRVELDDGTVFPVCLVRHGGRMR